MTLSTPITTGTVLQSWQHASGQDFEITGLTQTGTVYVALYARGTNDRWGTVSMMSEALAKTVVDGEITFNQNELFEKLKSAYKDGLFFKVGYYWLRIISKDGSLIDIQPTPGDNNQIRLEILSDEAVELPDTEFLLDEAGDQILDEAGNPIPVG